MFVIRTKLLDFYKIIKQTWLVYDYNGRVRQAIMRNLVRRYVTVQQRRAECGGVTEDDVNEIKQDVSAFRCELVEILRNSGMNTSTVNAGAPGSGPYIVALLNAEL